MQPHKDKISPREWHILSNVKQTLLIRHKENIKNK